MRDDNVMIAQFPSSVVANIGSFAPAPYFEIENAADRNAANVAFAG